jgi:hypothetical protein
MRRAVVVFLLLSTLALAAAPAALAAPRPAIAAHSAGSLLAGLWAHVLAVLGLVPGDSHGPRVVVACDGGGMADPDGHCKP